MYRLIGRLYFWLTIVPFVWKTIRPTLISLGEDAIRNTRAKMPPEEQARFDRFYPNNPARDHRSTPPS